MPKTTNHLSKPTGTFRTRTAVLAAGLGTSMMLGAGVSMAADTGAQDTLHSPTTASQLADSTRGQADKSAGKKADEKSWTKPVHDKYELSADFGNSGDRWAKKHSGQDFAVPVGTDVQSIHGGTVVKAGGNGAGDGSSYGNAIVIKHYDGSYSQYAHLSKIDVSQGDRVETGQKIAKSGNTGNTSGPHLHFEVRNTPDYGSAKEPVKALDKVDVHI